MSKNITYRDFIEVGNFMKREGVGKQRTFIEALDLACERNPFFPKNELISAFAEYLYVNGAIKDDSLYEVATLDAKIMGKFGRNYRMLDLFEGCAAIYMIREEIPRTSVELGSNNVVRFRQPYS